MKIKFFIPIALFLILFVSCNRKQDQSGAVLSVSIEPQRFFLEKLVGNKYSVNCLITSSANPETFDPTPSQLIALSKSEAYFAVGTLPFENIMIDKVKENNPNLKFVDCSSGIDLLDHECHHHHEFESTHDGGDPHTWSSPSTARVIIKNMYNALVDIDKVNADFYKENYDALLNLIDKTDQTILQYLDLSTSKSYIMYHPALSYFAHEYGLDQYTIEYDGKSPTPVYMARLIDKAKDEKIKIVLIQQEYDIKNAKTVAKEIGANIYQINLLNYNWDEELVKIAKIFSYE